MAAHNPPHPGEMLRAMLPDLDTNIIELACRMHLPRAMLSRVVNGRSLVSADIAVHLKRAG